MASRSRAGHSCNPACEERALAMARGELFWHGGHNAWVRTDIPRRRVRVPTPSMFGSYREKTAGPYLLDTCSYCGGDLPGAASEHVRGGLKQERHRS